MTLLKSQQNFDPDNNAFAHISHFGALKTSGTIPIIKANFPGSSLDADTWTETTVGSGSVTVASGIGSITTGTDSNGSVKLISVDNGVFEAGQVTVYQSGVLAGTGVANNIRRWGLMDSTEQNGLFFEWNGTTFRVVARKAGTDTAVESSSFSEDTAFSPGATNNTYRIHYSAGRAIFQAAQQGQLRVLHTMVRSDYPLVNDLDLNLYYENTNTGNTTDVEMRVRGASSSIFGNLPTIKPKNIADDVNDDTVMNPCASLVIGKMPDGVYAATNLSGTIDSTSTPLNNGSSWVSNVIDTEGFTSIAAVVYADQETDISSEWFSDSGATNLIESFDKTVSLNVSSGTLMRDIAILSPRARYYRLTVEIYSGSNMTRTDANIALYVDAPTPNQINLDTSLRDGTLVGINKSVIAGRDPDGVYQNVNISDHAGLMVADFLTEVSRGKVAGYGFVSKFGRNPDIDAGQTEDVWEAGGLYTGHPAHADSAETVEVFSGSANDTSAGTGARTMRIYGLDANFDEQQEDLTLNGTTAVTSANTYKRVFRGEVLTAGSSDFNEGVITCRHTTTTANVFFGIPADSNQTRVGAYTIPNNKTGYIRSIYGLMSRANGSDGSCQLQAIITDEGAAPRILRSYNMTNSVAVNPPLKLPLELSEKTDIVFRVTDVSDANTAVNIDFEIMLVDD